MSSNYPFVPFSPRLGGLPSRWCRPVSHAPRSTSGPSRSHPHLQSHRQTKRKIDDDFVMAPVGLFCFSTFERALMPPPPTQAGASQRRCPSTPPGSWLYGRDGSAGRSSEIAAGDATSRPRAGKKPARRHRLSRWIVPLSIFAHSGRRTTSLGMPHAIYISLHHRLFVLGLLSSSCSLSWRIDSACDAITSGGVPPPDGCSSHDESPKFVPERTLLKVDTVKLHSQGRASFTIGASTSCTIAIL